MGYGMYFPAHQVGGQPELWGIRSYGVSSTTSVNHGQLSIVHIEPLQQCLPSPEPAKPYRQPPPM
ncbi:hypothetical protein K443DRAFT_678242 [Laccaria amethystina LaAM-08-1]|uniref:Unplaced genomic scaffold K443scaffold_68, whole genome shotgun sequence n=1 Tax=Laccaria amethystina LaAM-08-1 TaxID=1095629 RepID=A0A0C9XJM9_9AGAR|nr:hypothetical protein K443DRAFT_678242 [Laccaria amethystina LaAM-08-1]